MITFFDFIYYGDATIEKYGIETKHETERTFQERSHRYSQVYTRKDKQKASQNESNSNPSVSPKDPSHEVGVLQGPKVVDTDIDLSITVSNNYKYFITSLSSCVIPNCVDEVRRSLAWTRAMEEEMKVLLENKI